MYKNNHKGLVSLLVNSIFYNYSSCILISSGSFLMNDPYALFLLILNELLHTELLFSIYLKFVQSNLKYILYKNIKSKRVVTNMYPTAAPKNP